MAVAGGLAEDGSPGSGFLSFEFLKLKIEI